MVKKTLSKLKEGDHALATALPYLKLSYKLTKEKVSAGVYIYINAGNKISRFIGTASTIAGLILLVVFASTRYFPNSLLPFDQGSASSHIGARSYLTSPTRLNYELENTNFTEPYRIVHIIEKGETLLSVLNKYGIAGGKDRAELVSAIKEEFKLSSVFTGQKIILDISGGYSKFILAKVNRIEIIENPEKAAVISWNDAIGGYTPQAVTYKLVKHTVETAGTIESSVSLAMQEQGIGKGAINDFLNLFSFDTDFQRDIRKGDKFDIVYNKFTDRDGNDVRSGDILVAELSIQGVRKRYYRYVSPDGKVAYYNYNGRSEQKALLKTPIAGARLSSGFGRRRHPILGFTKLHAGTDFAAPRGTPIFSAGDGTVEIAGRHGTFGVYIRIRHNGTYKTAYAHLRALALGVRSGIKVKQGQIIGYVGTTGRSTGPHLHYEVWKNGRPINSQRLRLASRKSLSGKELDDFKKKTKSLLKGGI